MKTLIAKDWNFEGLCSKGMVFSNTVFGNEMVIVEEVRLVRTGKPDIYLKHQDGEMIIEHNYRPVVSPSDILDLDLTDFVQTSREVVYL